MPNFNALQKQIRPLQPLQSGAGRSSGLPLEDIADYDQLKWCVEADKDAGHWIITQWPIALFAYELTAKGGGFL